MSNTVAAFPLLDRPHNVHGVGKLGLLERLFPDERRKALFSVVVAGETKES